MRAALALALLCSHVAAAECRREDFNRYVAAAVRLYEGLEYERALDQLAKAKEVSCGIDDDSMAGMYEGVVRSDLGQGEQAKLVFKEALLLKPDVEVPLKVSPKVKKLIEALRAEAKKELVPILARQEEERRKKLAEEAEKARREEDARRAEEQRKLELARADERARALALEEQRRAEEQRRLERERQAGTGTTTTVEAQGTDRPEVKPLTPTPSGETPQVVKVEAKNRRPVPVIPIIFGATAVAAGGVGLYFGVTARQSQSAALAQTQAQLERQRLLTQGNQQALIADVLFGVAGAAALGALISIFAVPSEPAEPGR